MSPNVYLSLLSIYFWLLSLKFLYIYYEIKLFISSEKGVRGMKKKTVR